MKLNQPISKILNSFLAFTGVAAALIGSHVYAISGDTGMLSGSFEIDGDMNISVEYQEDFHPTYDRPYAGIRLGAGDTVTLKEGYEDSIVTINPDDAIIPHSPTTRISGLFLKDGAQLEIGTYIVNGRNADITGIQTVGADTKAIIGDHSEIYAGYNGIAIMAYDQSTVVVGDNAVLWGTHSGAPSGVVAAQGGNITIGDHAAITNDGSYLNDNSVHHIAAAAYMGGNLTIGTDAVITVKNAGTAETHAAVYSGDSAGGGAVIIGDRAEISNDGYHGYGLQAQYVDSTIKVGKDSTITTTGNSGYAVLAKDGGTIEIGDGTKIDTSGTSAYSLYSRTTATGGSNGESHIITGDGVEITATGTGYSVLAYAADTGTADKNAAKITLGKNNVINSSVSGIVALNSKAKVTADDGLKITSVSYGVSARDGGEVVLGDSEITSSSYGIYATTGGIVNTTAGTVKITPKTTHPGVYVDSGASVTMGNTVISAGKNYAIYTNSATTNKSTFTGNGVFDVTGIIAAGTNSAIDLQFKKDSVFTGYTERGSTAAFDLAMTGSRWNITNDSYLNDVSVDALSMLVFTIGGASEADYVQIFSDMFGMTGSSVKVVLDGYAAQLGDEFLLVSSGGYDVSNITFEFSQARLAEGLFWDTSRFATTGIIAISDVPEPSSCAMICGALALGLVRYRRRK